MYLKYMAIVTNVSGFISFELLVICLLSFCLDKINRIVIDSLRNRKNTQINIMVIVLVN